MELNSTSPPNLHIALFPFMSKGHTIPLLHLTKLIHNHRPHATFTVFTTPANEPFVSAFLSSLPPNNVTIRSLPFSRPKDDIPMGVESSDQLPSMSLFHSFASSTNVLQPHFEAALEKIQQGHNPITFLICDGFFYWIQESVIKFNILKLSFYGMNSYVPALTLAFGKHRECFGVENKDDELIQLQDFPWIKVRKDEFDSSTLNNDPQDPKADFIIKSINSTKMSYGFVTNTFKELEQPFLDYINSIPYFPKSWSVGPLCLAEKPMGPPLERAEKPEWIKWLDERMEEGKQVLYVAFGSQAEISNEQLKEITIGLEKSRVNFLWVLRVKPGQKEVMHGFDERVKDRGLIVRSWVNQKEILDHESVQGFLSHCGWNSTIESICAGVPILAWPMMAEQPLNAKMVVEEIKVGLRVETCNGSPRGFVKWEGLTKMAKELMEGEMGKKVKENVKELSGIAKKSVEEGGSSWYNLESLLNELEVISNTKKKRNEGSAINGSVSMGNNNNV